MNKLFFVTLGSISIIYGFENRPWFGNVYECEVDATFLYSQYAKIDRSLQPLGEAYNNYVTKVDLSSVLSSSIELQLELELARTPHQTYGFRTLGVEGRYLFLDDIAGDPISLALGLSGNGVAPRSVKDVSSPYASYWNGEAILSLGKEISQDEGWKFRSYGFVTLGIGDVGSVWNRLQLGGAFRFLETSSLEIFANSYIGYGSTKFVDVDHFRGWGSVRHRSVDLGAIYTYDFGIYGQLNLAYSCRVLAKSYPIGEQSVFFSYYFPFSMF